MTPEEATRHLTALDQGELTGDEEHDLLHEALETIAGMHTEYLGQYQRHNGEWGTFCARPTRAEVTHYINTGCCDAYVYTRITRRHTTQPEETQ